jgi:hypothetical protein
MKFIKTFIFLLLIISCADKKSDNQTSEFDKILGIENVATVDFLVSDFENDFLKRQYPNLDTENAYRQFLTDLLDEKTENWKIISEKARNKFKLSDLRLEMYEFPDSVWILENSTFDKIESDSLNFLESPFPYIKSRYKHKNPDGTIEYTYARTSAENISKMNYDSIINRELNTPEFNYIGKYLEALESIKDKNKFYGKLFDVKQGFGYVSPKLTAFEMLDYGIDLNDELNKKIIVLELTY